MLIVNRNFPLRPLPNKRLEATRGNPLAPQATRYKAPRVHAVTEAARLCSGAIG